jgi:hypothetical protein
VGFPREWVDSHFASCQLAGHPWNRYGTANEETIENPDMFVCRGLRQSWPAFWQKFPVLPLTDPLLAFLACTASL